MAGSFFVPTKNGCRFVFGLFFGCIGVILGVIMYALASFASSCIRLYTIVYGRILVYSLVFGRIPINIQTRLKCQSSLFDNMQNHIYP